MRTLFFVLLSALAWADATTPLPTVRDAFVLSGGKVSRSLRLADQVYVVFCESEYQAWRSTAHPLPDILLYLNGRVMKGTSASQPLGIESVPTDDGIAKDTSRCSDASQTALTTEAAAKSAEQDAKSAADAAAKDNSPAAKQNADTKLTAAKTARATADAAAKQAARLIALTFQLDPALVARPETKDSWLQLLQRPFNSAPIVISVGTDTTMWPSSVYIDFQRIHLGYLAGWAALFAVAIVVFVRYAIQTDIIRDSGTLPATVAAGTRKAFSLGRTQMALWTFLVAAGLAFIFMVTWNAGAISNGVLALMGLSFGTTLLAAVSDGPGDPQPTQGFFTDLVTDGTGPSMHRYQMVLFTLILMVIFVAKTAAGLVMPEFDASLLALMGISDGTYLGFKLQGK